MTAYLKRILDWLGLILGVLCGPVAFCFLAFAWGFEKILSVSADMVGAVASFALPGADFDFDNTVILPLSRINAFIPLAENWVFMLAYLSLASQVLVFRFIKSLIPTMGN